MLRHRRKEGKGLMTVRHFNPIKVLAIVGGVIALGSGLWLVLPSILSRVPGVGQVGHWSAVPVLVLLWLALPPRFKALHGPVTLRGSVLIDAPRSAVWHRVLPHPGRKHFFRAVAEIIEVENDPDRFDLRFDPETAKDAPCLQLRIDDIQDHAAIRLSYLNAKDCPLWSKDLQGSEYRLETEGLKTRLTVIDRLDMLRLSSFVAMLFRNPCKASAIRVQQLCEHCPETSQLAGSDADGTAAEKGWEPVARRAGLGVCAVMAVLAVLGYWSVA